MGLVGAHKLVRTSMVIKKKKKKNLALSHYAGNYKLILSGCVVLLILRIGV